MLSSRNKLVVSCTFAIAAGCSSHRDYADAAPSAHATRQNDAPSAADVKDLFRLVNGEVPLSVRHNTPWELIHAAIGLGLDTDVAEGNGGMIRLSEYFSRGTYLAESIWDARGRRLHARRSSYSREAEYHANQFLAYFAMLDVPLDFPLHAGDRVLAVSDLLETARVECDPHGTNAYTLLALAAYGSFDDGWQNEFGQACSVKDLLASEIAVPERTRLACGGTHSLYAIAFTADKFRDELGREPALRHDVAAVLQSEIARCRESQGADGSLKPNLIGVDDKDSTEWRVYATGHSLEWLLLAISDTEAESAMVHRAAAYLVGAIRNQGAGSFSASPLYHALHALRAFASREAEL